VFYDKGSYSGGWRYLEAAPIDQSTGLQWYKSKSLDIKTSTAIGTGKANTAAIIAAQGAGMYAAIVCDTLVLGGYDDWFLPSKDELNLMYTKLQKAGQVSFGGLWFWSSSQYGSGYAWVQVFSDGDQGGINKDDEGSVRACRAF
jgi:hypothetical protein